MPYCRFGTTISAEVGVESESESERVRWWRAKVGHKKGCATRRVGKLLESSDPHHGEPVEHHLRAVGACVETFFFVQDDRRRTRPIPEKLERLGQHLNTTHNVWWLAITDRRLASLLTKHTVMVIAAVPVVTMSTSPRAPLRAG